MYVNSKVIEERMRQQTQQADGATKRKPDFLDILMQQTENNRMSVEELREQVCFL